MASRVILSHSWLLFQEDVGTISAVSGRLIGDFVLTGGEIPAITVINGVVRLLPGTLGSSQSLEEESHNDFLLEHPQYTRPSEFRGMKVPDILLSGNHKLIKEWRQKQREIRTKSRRPDLFELWKLDQL